MATIKVNVLFLGPSRDFAGTESCEVELPSPASVADLRSHLAARFEKLAPALPTVRFAVNDEFATDGSTLESDDEVAVIPPVSGGTGDGVFVDLVSEPIAIEKVRDFVGGDARFGGLVTFEGTTRSETDDEHGALVRLDYEAHESMARKQMEKLTQLAIERWGPGRVAVVHRTGPVAPAEVSVVIAVAFGHRKEAFEACRWLIDTLKHDVPIWKKDVFDDGYVRWVAGEIQNGE